MVGNASWMSIDSAIFQKNAEITKLIAQRSELMARIVELTSKISSAQQIVSRLGATRAGLPEIPVVTSFYTYSPQVSYAYVRGEDVTLTITGTGFSADSAATLYYLDETGVEQSVSLSVTYNSSTSLSADLSVTAGDAPLDVSGTAYLVVKNSDESASARMPVAVIHAPPSFDTVAVTEVDTGDTLVVTLVGTESYSMYPTTKIFLNNLELSSTYVANSPPSVEFTIPATLTGTVGAVIVMTVQNPGPGGGTSEPTNFTVV